MAGKPPPAKAVGLWRNVVKGEDGPALEVHYDVGSVLGKGAFGTVRLVKDKRTNELLACKSISKARLITQEDTDDVRREVEILNLLTPHQTIANLRAVYEDRATVHLVMEYCQGGELFERIIEKKNFSEADAARFFRQMVEMVHHCHHLGVMHRDIKPENFLLTDKTDRADLKACDFGLSDYYKPGQRFSSIIGSAYYVAPEVLRRSYDASCDIWSLGVILYILLSGMPPFWGDTEKDIFSQILAGNLDLQTPPWPEISEEAKDLVCRILTHDVAARLTAEQMLQHPWLREHGVASDRPLDSVVISRLRNFSNMTKLKKAAILAAAQYLSTEEIQGLRELFRLFDKNGDGHITLDELREGLMQNETLLSEGDLAALLQNTDLDGNGTIDYEEFVAAMVNLNLLEREEVAIKAFQQFDKDGSGTLTADEVAAAVGQAGIMSPEEAAALIATHDLNRDGVLDYSEFVQMLRENDSQLRRASETFKRGLNPL